MLHAHSLALICQKIGRRSHTSTSFGLAKIRQLTNSSFARWVYQRSIVTDGNFHADHLEMKYPEDDVALADGLAFMVETAPYEEHLKESVDHKQA